MEDTRINTQDNMFQDSSSVFLGANTAGNYNACSVLYLYIFVVAAARRGEGGKQQCIAASSAVLDFVLSLVLKCSYYTKVSLC